MRASLTNPPHGITSEDETVASLGELGLSQIQHSIYGPTCQAIHLTDNRHRDAHRKTQTTYRQMKSSQAAIGLQSEGETNRRKSSNLRGCYSCETALRQSRRC